MVIENGGGFLKTDSVILEIGFGFLFIPLEVQRRHGPCEPGRLIAGRRPVQSAPGDFGLLLPSALAESIQFSRLPPTGCESDSTGWLYQRVPRPGFRAPSKGNRISLQSSADPMTPLISRVPSP